MTQPNSNHSNKIRGTAVVVTLAALVSIGTVAGLNGCAKQKAKEVGLKSSSPISNERSFQTPVNTPMPSGPDDKGQPVAKKKVVKRPSTVSYSDSNFGVSFRYPRKYTLMTPERPRQYSAPLYKFPLNFVEPGGIAVAGIKLPDGPGTSVFTISIHKGLSAEECGQFSTPDAAEMAGDPSLAPSQVSVRGLEFSYVENTTEQTVTRNYHRYENETCYEFTLAVEETPELNKPVDYLDTFDKLDKILATVKIKPEPDASKSASLSK